MISEKSKIVLCLTLMFTLMSYNVRGDDTNIATTKVTLGVAEVALLKVNSSGAISLMLGNQDAGMSLESSKSDSTARLRISSVEGSTTRTLSAKITNGIIPAGSHLELVALQPNANFMERQGFLAQKSHWMLQTDLLSQELEPVIQDQFR